MFSPSSSSPPLSPSDPSHSPPPTRLSDGPSPPLSDASSSPPSSSSSKSDEALEASRQEEAEEEEEEEAEEDKTAYSRFRLIKIDKQSPHDSSEGTSSLSSSDEDRTFALETASTPPLSPSEVVVERERHKRIDKEEEELEKETQKASENERDVKVDDEENKRGEEGGEERDVRKRKKKRLSVTWKEDHQLESVRLYLKDDPIVKFLYGTSTCEAHGPPISISTTHSEHRPRVADNSKPLQASFDWYPPPRLELPLAVQAIFEARGSQSQQLEVQRQREKRTLKSFHLPHDTPPNPLEPEFEDEKSVVPIQNIPFDPPQEKQNSLLNQLNSLETLLRSRAGNADTSASVSTTVLGSLGTLESLLSTLKPATSGAAPSSFTTSYAFSSQFSSASINPTSFSTSSSFSSTSSALVAVAGTSLSSSQIPPTISPSSLMAPIVSTASVHLPSGVSTQNNTSKLLTLLSSSTASSALNSIAVALSNKTTSAPPSSSSSSLTPSTSIQRAIASPTHVSTSQPSTAYRSTAVPGPIHFSTAQSHTTAFSTVAQADLLTSSLAPVQSSSAYSASSHHHVQHSAPSKQYISTAIPTQTVAYNSTALPTQPGAQPSIPVHPGYYSHHPSTSSPASTYQSTSNTYSSYPHTPYQNPAFSTALPAYASQSHSSASTVPAAGFSPAQLRYPAANNAQQQSYYNAAPGAGKIASNAPYRYNAPSTSTYGSNTTAASGYQPPFVPPTQQRFSVASFPTGGVSTASTNVLPAPGFSTAAPNASKRTGWHQQPHPLHPSTPSDFSSIPTNALLGKRKAVENEALFPGHSSAVRP